MDIGIKMWRQEMAEAVEQRSLFRAPFSDVNRAGRRFGLSEGRSVPL
jgi:hypothetical protein